MYFQHHPSYGIVLSTLAQTNQFFTIDMILIKNQSPITRVRNELIQNPI